MRMLRWICSTLCGCKIDITAEWGNEPINENGVFISYRHPVPYTIELNSMAIVEICPNHEHFKTNDLSPDPYGGCPGYIKLPIQNPTEAQKLYIQLYQFSGQTAYSTTCGCKMHEVVNRFTNEISLAKHSINTVHCDYHINDYDHSAVRKENREKSIAVNLLVESHYKDFSLIQIPQALKNKTLEEIYAYKPQTLEETLTHEKFINELGDEISKIHSSVSFEFDQNDRSLLKVKHPLVKYLQQSDKDALHQSIDAKVDLSVTYK